MRKKNNSLRILHRDKGYITVDKAYISIVNNIVQSLKPAFGKKPLGQLMLASSLFKKIM